MRSLRRRFVVVIGFASLLAWLLLAGWQAVRIRTEVEALFDAHIAEVAAAMEALVRSEAQELAADDAGREAFDRFVRAQLQYHLQLPSYARELAYQIAWGHEGRTLQSANAPAGLRAPAATRGFASRSLGGADWRTLTRVGSDRRWPIVITVGEPLERRERVVRHLLLALGLPVVAGLLVLLWLLWGGIGWGLRPLEGLAREVGRRRPDNLRPIAAEGTVLEVVPLTDALNHLLGRLDAALTAEREFTADAAHELRTPLASIRTQAQVALGALDDAGRAAALAQVIAGVDRATRLTARLLDLARLDPGVDQDAVARVPLRQPVTLACDELAREAGARAVTLGNEVPEDVHVLAHPESLLMALRNLLENAVRHGASPGTVRVAARRLDPATVEITVEDDGPGIPRALHGVVQRRFGRAPGTRAPGSGLGLAIVARVAQVHRATLALGERAGGGLRVELHWPAAEGADTATGSAPGRGAD